MSKQAIISPIVGLLFCCCPIAIVWLIIAIVIFPFDAVLRGGPVSHVYEKIFEKLPSPAYFYSSFPVKAIGSVVEVIASTVHCHPDSIFGGITLAVTSQPRSTGFAGGTSARSAFSMSERRPANFFSGTAFTDTVPSQKVTNVAAWPFNEPTSKRFSSKIDHV